MGWQVWTRFAEYFQLVSRTNIRPIKNGLQGGGDPASAKQLVYSASWEPSSTAGTYEYLIPALRPAKTASHRQNNNVKEVGTPPHPEQQR